MNEISLNVGGDVVDVAVDVAVGVSVGVDAHAPVEAVAKAPAVFSCCQAGENMLAE